MSKLQDKTVNNSANKQISYPKPITRMFSVMIDVMLITMFLVPITDLYSIAVFKFQFHDFFLQHNIALNSSEVLKEIMISEPFVNYISQQNLVTEILKYWLLTVTPQIVILGIIFITFWVKYGTTPGKILTGCRIVDINTFAKPTLKQSCKRFFFGLFYIFGAWFMLFDKQNRTLHDKMSNTIVIKK